MKEGTNSCRCWWQTQDNASYKKKTETLLSPQLIYWGETRRFYILRCLSFLMQCYIYWNLFGIEVSILNMLTNWMCHNERDPGRVSVRSHQLELHSMPLQPIPQIVFFISKLKCYNIQPIFALAAFTNKLQTWTWP